MKKRIIAFILAFTALFTAAAFTSCGNKECVCQVKSTQKGLEKVHSPVSTI